jgi:Ca-activated chloride channel family protein
MPTSSAELSVTSHRRTFWRRVPWLGSTPPGRWLLPATWIGILIFCVTTLIVGGVFSSNARGPHTCSPRTTVTVFASPGHANTLSVLAQRWNASMVNDRCVAAAVVAKAPSAVAGELGPRWNRARDGNPPDVWAPDSSLWLTVAGSRADAARVLPAQQSPSIASSPVVTAVRQPIARAFGWPQRPLDAQQVVGAFVTPGAFTKLGHPEWSSLRVGMPDPSTSTAGLASVFATLDPQATGTVSDTQLLASIRFSQTLGAVADDTAAFFAAQRKPGGDPAGAVAAFPALERDVAAFNAEGAPIMLTPAYSPHAVVADYPYTVLTADWVDAAHRTAAELFLRYLGEPEARRILAEQGFRAPDQTIRNGAHLPADQGFQATFGPPRPIPSAAALNQVVSQWVAMQRPANVITAVDTSGSMAAPVPGLNMTRMQLLQQTAVAGFGLLTNRTNIGLWEFSARDGNLASEHRERVPFGPMSTPVGSVPRQQALLAAVGALRPGGWTPLYDTAYAAFHELQARYQPNTTNAVLLITDGKNETPGGRGLTLDQLIDKLTHEQRPNQPTPIIGIAVGPEADAAALQRISNATGGRTFIARDPAKAVETLILAFAGRLG